MGYIDKELGLSSGCSDRYESFSELSAASINTMYTACRSGCTISHALNRKKRMACYQDCIAKRDARQAQMQAEIDAGIAAGTSVVTEPTTPTPTPTNTGATGGSARPNLQTKDFGTKSAGFSAKNVIIGVAVLAAIGGVVYLIKKRND